MESLTRSADANVLALLSPKGGAGKTVIAASVATLLGQANINVLIVDCDASTNGLTLFYLDRVLDYRDSVEGPHFGLFEASEASAALDRQFPSMVPVAPNVDLLPSAFRLSNTESASVESFDRALREVIKRSDYDVIVLDAQAGSDNFAEVAARLSGSSVIVSEYDPISAEGIERLRRIFSAALPDSTWVLFNKVIPQLATSIGEFLSIARYLSPIPWTSDVVLAFAKKQLAIDLDGNAYTFAMLQVIRAVLPRPVSARFVRWMENSEAQMKDSVSKRIEQLRDEQKRYDRAVESEVLSRQRFSPWWLSLDRQRVSIVLLLSFGFSLILTVTAFFDSTTPLWGRIVSLTLLSVTLLSFAFVGSGLLLGVLRRREISRVQEYSLSRELRDRSQDTSTEINELTTLLSGNFEELYTNSKVRDLKRSSRAKGSA